MNSAIRGAILGSAGLALLGLAGCENNEANIKNDGITPPGAKQTSDESAQVKREPMKSPPPSYNTGYGPKKKMGPAAPPPSAPAGAEKKSETP
jgi:hypothetical protein